MREHVVRAEPLTSAGFAPFGQVVGADEVRLELRDDETFHLDVLSYDHSPSSSRRSTATTGPRRRWSR